MGLFDERMKHPDYRKAHVREVQVEALRDAASILAGMEAEPWNRNVPAIRFLHRRADEIERTTDE